MFSFFRSNPKLTPEEESDDILKLAHYKQRILKTSAYDQSSDYELLYSKIRDLTRGLLGRHKSILVPVEAEKSLRLSPHDYLQEESGKWRVRRDLDITTCASPMLMALAMLSYLGGDEIGGLQISQNRFFTNRVIEYLISDRQYGAAFLAKALLLMYGFQEYLPPRIDEARLAFTQFGYSDRSIQDEISSLPNLAKVSALTAKGIHASQTWRTHEALQVLLRDYHADNRNG